ncbi:MAG: 4-(cytidine 5'-diphospho)-2-C-methyl-D-erythritol kinase [Bifidobacteriaceae bacterium]|jgi:4-diphosphocytidyl-2-C-methyl-D-erythritol kinase|nr:4-(cytidine 5'-diphospho)-2-C-methyl-D-erythritol kinase [Bifidobacteriaceae bacterium]
MAQWGPPGRKLLAAGPPAPSAAPEATGLAAGAIMRPAELTAAAPAKINLALRVGPRRSDGYHPLNSLFHAVDLVERVTVGVVAAGTGLAGRADAFARVGCDELAVTGPQAEAVPLDQSNLACRAAALLRRRFGPLEPVRLSIVKSIPVAGGLAGGSADAAAALVALNAWWDLGLSPARLVELAAELGSDVPFAVLGGNAVGHGRGEDLRPLAAVDSFEWVLVTSPAGLSTPEVFARFDALEGARNLTEPPAIPAELLAGVAGGDAGRVGASLVNDLQPAAFWLRPELADVVAGALDAGARGAVVSGAGPTVACLAGSAPEAEALRSALADCYPAARILRATGSVGGAAVLAG